MNVDPKIESDQILAIFRDAVDQIKFSKEQQWKTTSLAVIVVVGIAGLPKLHGMKDVSQVERGVLALVISLVCIFGIKVVWQFKDRVDGYRSRLKSALLRMSPAAQSVWRVYDKDMSPPTSLKKRDVLVVSLQIASILFATGISIWLIFREGQPIEWLALLITVFLVGGVLLTADNFIG